MLFLMQNIYTFYLLSRAIVDSFDVNLFKFAMILCLCTELKIGYKKSIFQSN